jgi:hypothetical protein
LKLASAVNMPFTATATLASDVDVSSARMFMFIPGG